MSDHDFEAWYERKLIMYMNSRNMESGVLYEKHMVPLQYNNKEKIENCKKIKYDYS